MVVTSAAPVYPTLTRPPSRRLRRVSSAELTLASWWRDLRSNRAPSTQRGRYSLDKARKFFAHAATTSRTRRLAVLSLYPLPGLLIALGLSLLPLRDPRLGIVANGGFCVQVLCVNFVAAFSIMLLARAVASIDSREYPTRAIAVVAALTSSLMASTVFFVGVTWRFPIPFSWALASLPFITFIGPAHAVVFRGHRRLSARTRSRLLLVSPSIAVQISQMLIYPAYSALFVASKEWQQLVLVVLFPCLKFALKRSILVLTRHVGDFAREAASCGVEICASIYQATIMQGTPSLRVTVAIIGLDAVVNLFHVKRYMEHRSIVPNSSLVDEAALILKDTTRAPIYDHELGKFATRVHRPLTALLPASEARKRGAQLGTVFPSADTLSDADHDRIILVHTLELLQSAEVILLDEYLEVIVPFTNACFVVLASQLPSAVYNPTLVDFYFTPSLLRPAVASILLYTVLQGVTFAGMYVVMRVRYRLSAFQLLAFVMETHVWSLLAKLTMWFVAIMVLPVVHYGLDFTLTFTYVVRTS